MCDRFAVEFTLPFHRGVSDTLHASSVNPGWRAFKKKKKKKPFHPDEPHVHQTAPGSALGIVPPQTPGRGRRRSDPGTRNHPSPKRNVKNSCRHKQLSRCCCTGVKTDGNVKSAYWPAQGICLSGRQRRDTAAVNATAS